MESLTHVCSHSTASLRAAAQNRISAVSERCGQLVCIFMLIGLIHFHLASECFGIKKLEKKKKVKCFSSPSFKQTEVIYSIKFEDNMYGLLKSVR